ncbi:MAG: DUF427 domain-containing protein [Pseudomonadota bacterium]
MRAVWNDQVLAESNDTIELEGNHYFPAESLKKALFRRSEHETVCPWKGTANYLHVVVDGEVNENAAWYYREPKSAAARIKDRVAFWNGVLVKD